MAGSLGGAARKRLGKASLGPRGTGGARPGGARRRTKKKTGGAAAATPGYGGHRGMHRARIKAAKKTRSRRRR